MVKDRVQVRDAIEIAVGGDASAPNWPCPMCGRETTEHAREVAETEALGTIWRICSHPSCRHEYLSSDRSVLK